MLNVFGCLSCFITFLLEIEPSWQSQVNKTIVTYSCIQDFAIIRTASNITMRYISQTMRPRKLWSAVSAEEFLDFVKKTVRKRNNTCNMGKRSNCESTIRKDSKITFSRDPKMTYELHNTAKFGIY